MTEHTPKQIALAERIVGPRPYYPSGWSRWEEKRDVALAAIIETEKAERAACIAAIEAEQARCDMDVYLLDSKDCCDVIRERNQPQETGA